MISGDGVVTAVTEAAPTSRRAAAKRSLKIGEPLLAWCCGYFLLASYKMTNGGVGAFRSHRAIFPGGGA